MANHDELAQTATAPPTPSSIEVVAPRAMLGRFRIDAILGQGGMGIVHAAFDLELERNVALKVLRKAGSDDARTRLLREARAMAKLSHPNVIRVFDVGSEDGQDFVAMELVDGETLGDWLRREHPTTRTIIAAFVAAGRGLLAAHAAGLVHRDFKPSNVLRGRTGEILVTDFGLARPELHEAAGSQPHSDETPLTHTQTGALVGTPAYMAPEQWTAGTISAATDQYAFCVALWEALAGERPYRGDTIDELRTAVLEGTPHGVDHIPRSLRAILRRGLALDPAQRWPGMAALLSALERTTRRRRRWIVGAVLALGAVLVVLAVFRSNAPPISDCAPPALDPDAVWSVPRAFVLAGRDPDVAELATGDLATWRAVRSRACAAPREERMARLACLDGALARLDDAVGDAFVQRASTDGDDVAFEVVDPAMCELATVPRLTPLTRELAAAFRVIRRSQHAESAVAPEDSALLDHASTPCGKALRGLQVVGIQPSMWSYSFRDRETLRDMTTQCDDDKIRAELAIVDMSAAIGGDKRAEAPVARFPQADLRAALEVADARRASLARQWSVALSEDRKALELYDARRQRRAQLGVVVHLSSTLLKSGRAEDLAEFHELSARWLSRARDTDRETLEKQALLLRWHLGDLVGADAAAETAGFTPDPTMTASFGDDSMTGVTGEVVDEAGAPVANASVASGAPLVGDAVTISTRLYSIARRTTQTGPDGTFTLMFAHGAVVAQAGELRSDPTAVAPHVHLVVRRTTHVEGSVALGATPAHRVWVIAHSAAANDFLLAAPVRADGSFSLDGVPRGAMVIGAVERGGYGVGARPLRIAVDREKISGITLALTPQLYVIARSSDLVAPETAMVVAFSKIDLPAPTFASMFKAMKGFPPDESQTAMALPVDPAHVPAELAKQIRADDLITAIADRPEGALVVCGIGMANKQLGSTGIGSLGRALLKEKVGCTHVDATQSVVVLPLLPLHKFE